MFTAGTSLTWDAHLCESASPGPRATQGPADISAPSPGAASSLERAFGGGTSPSRETRAFSVPKDPLVC